LAVTEKGKDSRQDGNGSGDEDGWQNEEPKVLATKESSSQTAPLSVHVHIDLQYRQASELPVRRISLG
jgi:hypothetical protein